MEALKQLAPPMSATATMVNRHGGEKRGKEVLSPANLVILLNLTGKTI